MGLESRENDSWTWATVDTLLSFSALVVTWYPAVHYANALAGSPLSESTVGFVGGVLALATAYPFVEGEWSLGDLGEYLFVFLASAVGWGIVGLTVIGPSGVRFSGSDPTPQALVWGLAYLTAYGIVFRTDGTLFD